MKNRDEHEHDEENAFEIELNDEQIDELIYKLNQLREGGEHVHFEASEKQIVINHSETMKDEEEGLADKDVVIKEDGDGGDDSDDDADDSGDWINEEDEK